jgi:hypothetical protein
MLRLTYRTVLVGTGSQIHTWVRAFVWVVPCLPSVLAVVLVSRVVRASVAALQHGASCRHEALRMATVVAHSVHASIRHGAVSAFAWC